jgi:hypothetical protein
VGGGVSAGRDRVGCGERGDCHGVLLLRVVVGGFTRGIAVRSAG